MSKSEQLFWVRAAFKGRGQSCCLPKMQFFEPMDFQKDQKKACKIPMIQFS